ncbi:hypothetical protein OU798_04100 [Prolixibacteraceae bacterium Z1-6]|uniref:Porin n=1 Tax=Draconibacterium aestuarii TaxID=2998507 RepID=A0A9X3F2T3_9BACT|nr:hypothetical protein [Prolixibacteraceae bacterium Z1-6]
MGLNKYILFLLLVLVTWPVSAQSKFDLNGYISNMGQSSFAKDAGGDYQFANDFTLHNRINIAYYASDNLTAHVQFRNQFVWGQSMKQFPGYADEFAKDRGFLHLNFNWWQNSNNLMNTQFDRAYIEYTSGNLELSLGRQRVNWGRTLVWNPNDIFNAFSYYDIDYMERPGSDALRAKYYLGTASSAELVAKLDSVNNLTLAGLYKFNKWSYDIQFMGGYVKGEDFVIGTGWEGNIGKVAFRGEASYYHPEESFADTTGVFLASVGFDYLVNNKLTVQWEFLYNDPQTLIDIEQSPSAIFQAPANSKTLSFSKYNLFANFSYIVNPILTANLAGMYYTDYQGFFLMPAIDFSISSNLYFSVMYQYFNLELHDVRSGSNVAYARLKWNF